MKFLQFSVFATQQEWEHRKCWKVSVFATQQEFKSKMFWLQNASGGYDSSNPLYSFVEIN